MTATVPPYIHREDFAQRQIHTLLGGESKPEGGGLVNIHKINYLLLLT